jgi:eukaryotic-like serine/threonine-protein kinase
MLTPDGSVKVLDFGLAVGLDGGDLSRITRTGQALGTPSYMAPEQVLAGMSGPHTDLYALGCTLHEMLTGRPLFTGSTAYTVMNKQVDERPRPLRLLRPDLPDDLDRLVLTLLEKKPEDRPADAEVVYRRLLPFVTGLGQLPGVLAPPSAPSPTRMYAGVLSRIFADGAAVASGPRTGSQAGSHTEARREPVVADGAPLTRVPADPDSRFGRDDLERARRKAASLVRQSRYSQAAEVLAAVAEPAARALGSTDSDVVSLRRELADVLFEGGDYRNAGPAYRRLATDLADRGDTELVFRSRLQEATCNALLGQTGLALRQLQDLRDDEQRAYGHDDPRVLELRFQIGLLQLGSGQRAAADATLRDLLSTVVRLHGPDHPTARRIRELRGSHRREPTP